MQPFRIIVAPGAEAERFNAAFYRFLELQSARLGAFEDCGGMMQSTPSDTGEEKEVRFWSEEAERDFRRFWRDRLVLASPVGEG